MFPHFARTPADFRLSFPRGSIRSVAAILLGAILSVCPRSAESTALAEEKAARPNFVVIFTDDQGYQDLGCFGSPDIETPNIDRMAKEGVRFTNFYVAQAVCSASRTALLTG